MDEEDMLFGGGNFIGINLVLDASFLILTVSSRWTSNWHELRWRCPTARGD